MEKLTIVGSVRDPESFDQCRAICVARRVHLVVTDAERHIIGHFIPPRGDFREHEQVGPIASVAELALDHYISRVVSSTRNGARIGKVPLEMLAGVAIIKQYEERVKAERRR